jgi:hypothetical protein
MKIISEKRPSCLDVTAPECPLISLDDLGCTSHANSLRPNHLDRPWPASSMGQPDRNRNHLGSTTDVRSSIHV